MRPVQFVSRWFRSAEFQRPCISSSLSLGRCSSRHWPWTSEGPQLPLPALVSSTLVFLHWYTANKVPKITLVPVARACLGLFGHRLDQSSELAISVEAAKGPGDGPPRPIARRSVGMFPRSESAT